MEFVIITGMSGAGRTQTTKFMEDLGYFCIDNIPTLLLPKFGELYEKNEMNLHKFALVMDVRGGNFVDDLYLFTDKMKSMGVSVKILFLDCADNVLVSRHKENKKLHPLASDGDNMTAVGRERKLLSGLREHADYIIDTTNFSIWELKKKINELFAEGDQNSRMKVNVISFGYKHGVPEQADLMFDVRFLPNPYYVAELRTQTGNDEGVSSYVLSSDGAQEFLVKTEDLLKFLLPRYQEEGKEVLVIAIGCTGGHHRSVAISNEICRRLSRPEMPISLTHRDIGKP